HHRRRARDAYPHADIGHRTERGSSANPAVALPEAAERGVRPRAARHQQQERGAERKPEEIVGDNMDHFSTARLTAERLNEGHLEDLVALHLDAEVSRFLGGVRSAETTKAYLAANMAHWDQHGFGLWALRTKDGAFAGRAGIRHILVDGVDEIELAYTFGRDL